MAQFKKLIVSPPLECSDTESGTSIWLRTDLTAFSGSFVGRQIFTSGGTYTPNTKATTIIVECTGPGGGGGGAASAGGGTAGAVGGGGASGFYAVSKRNPLTDGAQTITIGAGGAGGANTGANGSDGSSNTSYGTLVVANPGKGGQGQSVSSTGATVVVGGQVTGATSVGDIVIKSCAGYRGLTIINGNGFGGNGAEGVGPYGGGGGNGADSNGVVAAVGGVYGSGGGGAWTGQSGLATGAAGAAGASGIVVITEYA